MNEYNERNERVVTNECSMERPTFRMALERREKELHVEMEAIRRALDALPVRLPAEVDNLLLSRWSSR